MLFAGEIVPIGSVADGAGLDSFCVVADFGLACIAGCAGGLRLLPGGLLKYLRLIRHLVIRNTLLNTHFRMTENPRPAQRFAMFTYRLERTIWTSILPAISFVRSSALYAFASL